MVVLGLYSFTKDQLLESELEILTALDYDICCVFGDDLRRQLDLELAELAVRI